QGAMLLSHPERLENPFFLLYPDWALLPMVVLATIATIIASQAVISGAFSLTHQAMQLGLLPRMEMRRTSETEKGQIYIPRINWLLLVAVLYIVFAFRSSSALASAYGVAVTGTMVITSIMAFLVMWRCWQWKAPWAALAIAPFLAVDLIFLLANLLKVFEGCRFRCIGDCTLSRCRFDFLAGHRSLVFRCLVAARHLGDGRSHAL